MIGAFVTLAVGILALLSSAPAWAACSSPSGNAGSTQMISSVLKFCNNTKWISTKQSSTGSCSGTPSGRVRYTSGDLQFCDATNWYSMKGASTFSNCSGQDGKTRYSSSHFQFCDGTNWYYTARCPWTLANSGIQFKSIASSSNGTKLAAVVYGGSVYTSTNGGTSWTERTGPGTANWIDVASSSDGTKLIIADGGSGGGGGPIWTSTDSGANWTQQTNAGSRAWTAVASSSDGTKLVAVMDGSGSNYAYTSTNSGANWTQRTVGATTRRFRDVTSSADGTIILAASISATGNDALWLSTDSGVNWSQKTPTTAGWFYVNSSADGTILYARGIVYPGGTATSLYYSNNTGSSWNARSASGNGSPLAVSSDGQIVLAYDSTTNGPSLSTDAGATWAYLTCTGGGHPNYVSPAAMSADGSILFGSYSTEFYKATDWQ